MRLKGKVSIITGAGSGLGRAIALRFGEEGSRIVVCDINREGGEETLSKLSARSCDAVFVQTDVASNSEVQEMVDKVVRRYGQIDILVNNAAYVRVLPLLETPLDVWQRTFDVNVTGYFLTCKYVIPKMIAAGGGVVVNISSIGALSGASGIPAYAASKAAIINFTKSLTVSYRSKNIRANCILPGIIETPLIKRVSQEAANWAEGHPGEPNLRCSPPMAPERTRPGRPEEYAAVALFLASDEASYVNGAAIIADGGATV